MRDLDLLESLTVEASKLGANTIFTFTPSEHTLRRLLLEVPAKYDSGSATADMKLAEIITVMFTVDTSDGQGAFATLFVIDHKGVIQFKTVGYDPKTSKMDATIQELVKAAEGGK
jgi:hypothetical protein